MRAHRRHKSGFATLLACWWLQGIAISFVPSQFISTCNGFAATWASAFLAFHFLRKNRDPRDLLPVPSGARARHRATAPATAREARHISRDTAAHRVPAYYYIHSPSSCAAPAHRTQRNAAIRIARMLSRRVCVRSRAPFVVVAAPPDEDGLGLPTTTYISAGDVHLDTSEGFSSQGLGGRGTWEKSGEGGGPAAAGAGTADGNYTLGAPPVMPAPPPPGRGRLGPESDTGFRHTEG